MGDLKECTVQANGLGGEGFDVAIVLLYMPELSYNRDSTMWSREVRLTRRVHLQREQYRFRHLREGPVEMHEPRHAVADSLNLQRGYGGATAAQSCIISGS